MIKPILQFNPLFVLVFVCASLHAQHTNINVSGGQFSEPYFNFSDENGSIDLDTFEFIAGKSYRFTAVQGFSPHPFQIGSSPGTPSQYSSGGPLSSVGDELVLEIPSNFDPYSSSLHFYCTAHTSMRGQLTVVAAGGESGHNDTNHDYNYSTGESLDGSVIYITGEDSVKETLIFENGTVTSIFDEGEGQTPFTTEDLSYSIEDDTSGHLVIIDGDLHYLFYESNGTGNLLDYSNNGQLDESGSWGFSYVLYEWEEYDDFTGTELNSGKWGTMYLGGGIEPYVSGGKLRLSGNSGNPSATKVVKSGWEDVFDGDDGGQAWVYPKDSDIIGIEGEFLIPSSASSKSGLQVGVASLNPLSFATAELNAELNSESQYSQGFGFYHLANNGTEVENFGTTQRDTTHRLGVTLIDGIIKLYVDGEIRYEGLAETFNTDMFFLNGFNDYQQQGLAFELTVDNVRVLRRQGENSGHDEGNETTSPEGGDSILSDSNGNPIVNQEGNEYGWNDTLDGVTIWLVGYDSGELIHATMKYENGQVSGNFELIDEVTNPESSINYFVNDQGNLVWEESNGYQYFQIHSVIDGRIEAIGFMNDSGTADNASEPSEFFFTNRAAAEEFYNLKLNEGGSDNGNQNDGNETEDESVPIFFLSSSILLELTGEEGLAEGNYAISEDYEWNEETQSEEFGFWIEPAELSDSQDWIYAGGETEDGHLIVENYQGEDLLRQYFVDNQLSEVGQIADYHDEYNDTDHDSDEHESNSEQLGTSPESLAGFIIKYQEIEDDNNTGAEIGQGWEEVKFSDAEVSRWDEDDQQIVFESYTYSKTGPSTGTLIISNANEQYTLNLSFNANMHGVGEWIETDDEGTFSGSLEFELLHDSTEDAHDDEFTPIEEVEEFVNELKNSIEELTYSDAVWVEKKHDALVDGRFVYEVGLNNMINIYFDQNGSYIHAAEDYMEERQFIPKSEISQSIKDLILAEVPNSEIIDFEVEFSRINVPGNDNQIFFAVIENNQSESFEVVISGDGERVIIVMPFDDVIPWRPVELPEVAVQYLADNYAYDDGYPMNYWEDQRPTPDGNSMEFVAYLEDGREVIFNENGSFNREFNPWDIEEDAKLSFNPKRSAWGNDLSSSNFSENTTGGDDPAYVHIEKLNLSSSHNGSEGVEEHTGADNWDDMIYRISLVNTVLGEDANLTRSDLELGSTLLPAGTPLKLTFTYETGEPRYILLSGGKVRGFKRTWPEWDRPGTITVLAETVDPVATSGTDLSSTFGMIVVMGGERWYNGAIFQANVPVLDMMPSEMISPYEQVAGFSLVSETSADANISAFLPRDLLEWNFGISEPHRVKAGLMDENGSLLFINGSGADEEGAEFTGGGFTRVIHKGHEPDFAPYPQEGGGDDDYKLGDEDSDEGFIDSDEQSEEGDVKSKFDFNADGYGDSLLEIRFHAGAFPSDIGFGDPYEDPYKDLNKENMGSISGNVLSDNGAVIPDVGLWFFQAPDGLDGPWEPAFFILDINHSSGFYEAYLPTGVYYVEAWGFDPTTNTPYKSEVSSQSFSIIDGNSSFSYDISLEADFVVSHEFGQISSRLNISGHEEGHPLDISLELYPVDQNGTRQTDYPTGWLWVEPDGKIQGEAPAGRYEVVLFSYDNSVRLSGGTVHWDVVANQLNEFSLIEAAKSQPLAISGMVRDADTNNGIWAEVIFVDPNDEFREFWPSWEHDESESFIEGSYSVKIPAGTYKIKAMRWDGLYQSEFYTADGVGTTDFSAAAEVVINANKTDIDFNLNGSPAAQVAVRIVDANTSSAVEFAWFAFFDAEDEYGPVVYPHVQETEGNYSLKLPGGSYKLMAEAGGYEPKYLVTNADGSYTWASGDWSSAASLVLTDSNTTSLPLVELNAFAQEDHERYDFDWFDGDANITFGTISGTVVTNKGNAVPKARIVAHTDDYLFWFDHFETKIDGSYELSNLPSGNWIVIAEPPFESEEYLGYRSSQANWESPISVDANTTSNIKLTLQGSNVSGRIMYPKKDENGRVKLTALADAFLWAFQDENQTGEPNYEYVEGEDFIFNEAYGETNSDGFFSLSLPEAGKYSIRIEVPGNLANLALAPIHFELKNPSKEMRLGNAIRVDWSKSDARASTYKLERKASTESVYTSVDANISGTLKSYIDSTATPGVSYEYKVTATTATGTQALATTAYKVSKPFIYLVPPNKTITGKVRDDLNASISGAEVVAVNMNGEGWANTFSDNLGDYELSVGPGKWEVTVYRPWDENVNWSYDKAPKVANFAESANKTIKTLNFTVNRMGDGKVVGTIAIPNGMTDVASSIWIDVFTPDGIGNWANPESNGSFSIPLKPGQYEFSVWLDPEKFKGYGSPEPQFIRVGKTEVDVGTIVLAEFNSTISGVIATSSGSPLGNAEVWAWSETGGWTSDVTDTTGAFELKVAPGRWEIGFNPPIPADGSESPYLLEPPKRIKVGDGVKTLNFTVRKAASKVEGVVYGPSGAPVADLNAWAYAREAGDGNNSDEFLNVLAEVALSPRGTFSFPGLPGTYTVGLWMPPGSDYAQPGEQTLTLSDTGVLTDGNGTSMNKIEFTLAKVDSYVAGSLIDKDTNQSISGLVGEVYAMRTDGDGWQYASIETNGTYSMLLPPGNWVVEYYLEYDDQNRNYPKASAQPLEVIVQQGATVEGNFVISAAGASISGSVVYDSNSSTVSESTLYVWAYREGSPSLPEYWDEVETDDNGSFTISVLQGGKYEVGVILSNDLREEGYLEPAMQKFKMSTSTKTGLEFRLAQPAQDNYLSGTVVDGSGNSLAGAFVYAWTYDGRESSVYADNNGDFNMTVPSGALWKLGAEFSEFDANDTEILYFAENDVEADLRKNEYVSGISIVLARPEFEVPDGISITFDPSKDFVTTLPDGTEITIPGGAANVSSDVKTIRLVVTPTAKGLDKSGTDKPADYAYSMELFDDKGKEIEGNFKKDVVIRIPVDVDSFRNKGIDLDTLEGMYYSPTKKAWAKAKTSTFDQQSGKLTMTTDHFTVNSLVGQTAQSDLVADTNTSSLTGYDNWYQSDWLGSFFDASADKPDWVFHVEEKLGWMWVKTDAAGNYWFNHITRGWLWTGADYFIEGDDTKSHFYSFSLGRWLYFHPQNGFYDYEANGGSYLD